MGGDLFQRRPGQALALKHLEGGLPEFLAPDIDQLLEFSRHGSPVLCKVDIDNFSDKINDCPIGQFLI